MYFMFVLGKEGEFFILDYFCVLCFFLGKGDFVLGSWGYVFVDEFVLVDLMVEKIVYLVFYQLCFEYVLQCVGIEMLIFLGIVMQGGVVLMLCDVYVCDFYMVILSDGCVLFCEVVYEMVISDLVNLLMKMSCVEVFVWIESSF